MSQSSSTNPGDFPDYDPLSSFDPEDQAALRELPPPYSAPITPAAVVTSPDCQSLVATLAAKLDEAAREIERSTGEVAALRGELATIVAKVRDIERRAGRDEKQIGARKPVVMAPERHRFPAKGGVAQHQYLQVREAVRGVRIPGWEAALLALLVLGTAILWRPAPAPSTIDRVQPIASPSVPLVTVAAPGAPVATAPVSDPRPIPIRERVEPAESYEPREFLGTLAVQTDPAGAEVFVNHKSVGNTPLRLPALRAGAHLLWIELDGYQRWTRVVTVPADQVTSVSAQLERQ